MASSRRYASRHHSPVPQRFDAHEDAPPNRRSPERLADGIGAGSKERDVHKEFHQRSSRSKHSSTRWSAADEGLLASSGSLQTEWQSKHTLSATSPKKAAAAAAADAAPRSEVAKDRSKPSKKRSSSSPQKWRVRSKWRATTSTSRSGSSPAFSEHEIQRPEEPTVQTAPATRPHDQAKRHRIELAVEEDARKRAKQCQSESQAQEDTELLTEGSRLRLEYFVLCLGTSIVTSVLSILILRFVYHALANRFTGIVSPGKNASEVSEGQASARAHCLDVGACRDAYASVLRESIDTDADPCLNFYKYACGGWLRNHEESTGLTAWRQYTIDAIERLRVEQVSTRMRGEPVGQAAHFWETCLKVGSKAYPDTRAHVDIKEVLAEAGLTWPARSEHSDLVNSLFFMARRVGLPVFFNVGSGYTKIRKLRAIFFRLDTAFQKTTIRLVDMLKKESLSMFVRSMYRAFAEDGVVNETRFDEVIGGLESLAGVLDIYLEATDDPITVRDIASLQLYAPSPSFEKWSSAFRKFFDFDFAELNATNIYDLRSFSAIFRYVLVYGEAVMKDAFGFLSIMAAVSYTSSEIRDAFFGSPKDASFHQEQYCSLSSYAFYGDALNHFFFEKARAELKMFEDLQELIWKEFPGIVGPNGTLIGAQEPLPRNNHLHGVSEFLRKSEPEVFMPRYKSYPNLTNSALRNWIALTDHRRKLGFTYNGPDFERNYTDCASQCDATIFTWRLTPYHLTFPWYSPGIHRGILFAGLATRIAAAIFLDYVDRNELRREQVFEENQKCLRSVNPSLDEASDIGLQAGVAAVLASSALLAGTSGQNSSLIGSGVNSLQDVGDVKGSQVFFAFGCHLLCGDDDAERLCNLPLRHSVEFAHAFNCEVGTNMNPRRKCHLRV